jgi:CheY-like chemotaxis protein
MPITILIVEDDAAIRESLCDALSAEGFDAQTAEHGGAALAYLERSTPHLILLDLLMPVMNGSEFRARQLANPRIASIPVIIVSAYPVAAVHGPVLYLPKPVHLEPLLAMIARALGDEDREEG